MVQNNQEQAAASELKRDWKATIRSPWFWCGFFDELFRGAFYILYGALMGALIVWRHYQP
jgi:hypothetical protein